MIRCAKCILPETYPGIQFDSEGQCNVCRRYTSVKDEGEQALFDKLASLPKRNGKYDCIVTLSGGRDSTYILIYVVDKLKLRPLVLTIDNGFMPDQTRQNVDNTVKILGVDHDHMYVQQRVTMKSFSAFLQAWVSRPDPSMIGFLCNGCRGSLSSALIKTTKEFGLNLVFFGGGEPQTGFAKQLLRVGPNYLGKRGTLFLGAIYHLFSNPKYFYHPSYLKAFAEEGITRYWTKYPEDLTYVSPFTYIGWNEEKIVNQIQERVGWAKPECWTTTWRSDCKIHWLKEYLYKETLGFTKNDDNLSGMVRSGMITRDEALERLHGYNESPVSFLADFVAEHGLDFDQLRNACQRYRKSQDSMNSKA